MMVVRKMALCCACVLALGVFSAPSDAMTFPTKLFLSQDGIALSAFPKHSLTKKSIKVQRTQGRGKANWTASADQPWLSVTANGTTGDNLTVNADPAGLTPDQLYSANVTVSTDGADFTDTETLHVGFWVGSHNLSTVKIQQNATSIAANPVLPIAYVNNGSSIREYNVYTGAVVGTLKSVAPSVGFIGVSSDGGTLFAADTTNQKIVALDANSGTVLGKYPVGFDNSYGFNIVYTRLYGQPALVVAGEWPDFDARVIAYPSGEQLLTGISPNFVAATADGHNIYSVWTDVSPGTIYGYHVTLKKGALALNSLGEMRISGENCQDLAVSQDAKHVYPACGAPYEFDVYDGKTLQQVQTLPASNYPNNIEIDENDRVVGGLNGIYNPDDVFVYSQKGKTLDQVATTDESYSYGQQSDAMAVSGDGTRVISITAAVYNQNQTLMFRTLH